MKTQTCMAVDVSVGDLILLDCGYGAHSHDEPCRVLEIQPAAKLFGGIGLSFEVEELLGERFTTLTFDTGDKLTRVISLT